MQQMVQEDVSSNNINIFCYSSVLPSILHHQLLQPLRINKYY